MYLDVETNVFLITFICLLNVMAQWNSNWQQQPSGRSLDSVWGSQQNSGFNNNPPQQPQNFNQNPSHNQPVYQMNNSPNTWSPPGKSMSAPSSGNTWTQYNPQPPPTWNNAPQPFAGGSQQPAQQAPPAVGVATLYTTTPSPVETNGNHVPKASQWLPPGHPEASKPQLAPQPTWTQPPNQAPPAARPQPPPQPPPQQWPGINPQQPARPSVPVYTGTNPKLIDAINKMTAAFTKFQVTLEKLLTSLGKLTQLQ